jgi:hypothetical protein
MVQLWQAAKFMTNSTCLWNALDFWRFVRVVGVDGEGKVEGAALVHA